MQHFDDSGHSFAKIAIPYTIYLSLNLLAILAISVVLQICFDKKEIDKTIYTQKASPKLQSAPIHISMNQGAFYILTDEVLTKSLL